MSEASYMYESQMGDWAEADCRERDAEIYEAHISEMKSQYESNKKAHMGTTIDCACLCGVKILKKNYQTQFAISKGQNNCKDKFWNNTNDKRRSRAQTIARYG